MSTTRPSIQISREELLGVVRAVVGDGRRRVSLRKFSGETGIPESAVYRQFASWGDAREAAGLDRWMSGSKRHSDDELLAEFHAVSRKTWGMPSWGDIKRHSKIADGTYRYRFGSLPEVVRRYRKWLRDRNELGERRGIATAARLGRHATGSGSGRDVDAPAVAGDAVRVRVAEQRLSRPDGGGVLRAGARLAGDGAGIRNRRSNVVSVAG